MDTSSLSREARKAMIDHGIRYLKAAFSEAGISLLAEGETWTTANGWQIVLGHSGNLRVLKRLESAGVFVPPRPEALCIQRFADPRALVIYGHDERGFLYALLETGRQIELHKNAADPLGEVLDELGEPHSAVRSVFKFYYNTPNDNQWFYAESFWDEYFSMLIASRYNAFTLLYGGDTPTAVFPLFSNPPGFESVQVKGLPPEEREKNLAMLETIATMAAQKGLEFGLALWGYGLPKDTGIVGLTAENLPHYCAASLKYLLQKCPSIARLQLRSNDEAGVSKEDLTEFWAVMLSGISDCGRQVKLDIRAKGLTEGTLQIALSVDRDLVVSTKYWTEHMGLPYHQVEIQSLEKRWATKRGPVSMDEPDGPRYGYGTLLRQPLRYRFISRLWTFGSHRIVMFGDPEYVRKFVGSTGMGGGCGFEIGTPLGYQGHWDQGGEWSTPGTWHEPTHLQRYMDDDFPAYWENPEPWLLFSDPQVVFTEWDELRYWYLYLLFGRLGYNPKTSESIWLRELEVRFGPAAPAIERAFSLASKILPTITSARTTEIGGEKIHGVQRAANRCYLPLVDPGGTMEQYNRTEPGDPGLFYGIDQYVHDVISDEVSARYSPLSVREWLVEYANGALTALAEAEEKLNDLPRSPEFNAIGLDVTLLALTGLYHGERLKAGVAYAFFKETGDLASLYEARRAYDAAVTVWEKMARLSEGKYSANLHGLGGQSHPHHEWWVKGLPRVKATQAELGQIVQKAAGHCPERPTLIHVPQKQCYGESLRILATALGWERIAQLRLYHQKGGDNWASSLLEPVEDGVFAGSIPVAGSEGAISYYLQGEDDVGETIRFPLTGNCKSVVVPRKPVISAHHEPKRTWQRGEDLELRLWVSSSQELVEAKLHYRYMNQLATYVVVDLERSNGEYHGTISKDYLLPQWDVIYFFTFKDSLGNTLLYPGLETPGVPLPYFTVSMENSKRGDVV